MVRHKWIKATSSKSWRMERWTHICTVCRCRKGTSKYPGRGVRPIYQSHNGEIVELLPDCEPPKTEPTTV